MDPATMVDIRTRVDNLKVRYAARDQRMYQMRMARKGQIGSVFADLFPSDWPKPIIANVMDIAARDVAEMLAPLPAINCSSGMMASETARKFSDRRTQIAYSYLAASKLSVQMYSGTDQFATYGFMPIVVEPDFDMKMPKMRVDDPFGGYPDFDRWGNLVTYVRRYEKTVGELVSLFPESAAQIRGNTDFASSTRGDQSKMELIHWIDKSKSVMYLPEAKNHVLSSMANKLSRIPVVVSRRPGLDPSDMTGEFDEILWVWIARARFALLALEAATKAVDSPIVVPEGTQDLAFGPDAILRTPEPQNVRRLNLDMPSSAFATEQVLEREARIGARYPESRSGSMDASVITGRGIQELNGGFDSRVRAYQTILAEQIKEAVSLCFEMDEVYWPEREKNVRGTRNGAPYEVRYKPSKDIKGDYTVDVQYGLMAGLDPNRAMVFALQGRGDKLFSRDFTRRQLPFEMDVMREEQQVDVEDMRDYLKQGIAGTVQAMPLLVEQGQNPIDLVNQLSEMIAARVKGSSIEDAAAKAFTPKAPPAQDASGASPLPGADAAPAGGPPSGLPQSGLMPGVAPGQAGMPPGGRPDIKTLLAGLTAGGKPNLQASIQKRQPI